MQLNQLYGYFGRSRDLIITKLVNRIELQSHMLTNIVSNIIEINNDVVLLLMKSNLNYDVIRKISDELKLEDLTSTNKYVKSNVAISAAVTAYAQIEMMKYKQEYKNNIYYSDTDSIFLDCPLPEENIGNELGQMKNELISLNTKIIDKAIFIGNKQYGYIYKNNNGEIKTKSVWSGVKKETIT